MTLKFDKKAIKESKIQHKLFDNLKYDEKTDAKVCDMIVKKVPASFVRPYVATNHYSHIMPDNAFECYAGFYGDKLAGVIVFGNGANNATFSALIPDMELRYCRELTRLWSADGMPKNTESKLIAESIELLPEEVYMVVSFADPSHNHVGTIYQATNFLYCGMSSESQMLLDKDGTKFHVRTIGSYRRRHPELQGLSNKEIMKKYEWTYTPSPGKHRYVYLRGPKWIKNLMLKELNGRIMEYPKLPSVIQ
jgi:hypothetical protein